MMKGRHGKCGQSRGLLVAWLMVGLGGGLAWGQEKAGAPVVPNAGWEEGDEKGPSRWTWGLGEGGKGQFHWETQIAHTGHHSFRVLKQGVRGYTVLLSDFVPVEAGKEYRVSAWVYPLKRVPRGVYLMVSQYAASGAQQPPNAFGNMEEALDAEQWQQVSVRVQVRPGVSRIRIHCLQAFVPSEVCWDDVEVLEASQEPPPRYEPPPEERLPDLEPAKAVVARRPQAWAKVELQGERPRLVVDGKVVPWAFYVSPFWVPQKAQIGDFRRAGVRIYLVPLVLGWQVYGNRGPWRGKDQYDFSEIDDLLWRVLRVDPEGYILFYLCCDPYREWGAEHPDHVTTDQHGQKAIVLMHPKRWGENPKLPERYGPSPVSLLLRADIAKALRELVRYVDHCEPGKAVIGYHVAGFNDGQWTHWHQLKEEDFHWDDYCPGAQESFREWLQRRYQGQVQLLRRAWHQPQLTFETAALPPFERYWAPGTFLDPATQQDIADYTRFYAEGIAETVDYLAGVLKEASSRPIICGTYYPGIIASSVSHLALAKHLSTPAIDYLAAPAAYMIRMPGYCGAVRSVFGSTLLHGKMFLTEQDWRSWLARPAAPEDNFSWGRAETPAAHNAMVRRESGMMLAFGLGTWWYDMGGGWFRDDQIMAAIAEVMQAFQDDLRFSDLPQADVAVFVSEESNDYICPPVARFLRQEGIVNQIPQLNTSGVPYRLYLLSDLGRLSIPEHRVYIFLNAYYLTPAQREAIENLKRDGKLLVFVHAPGVIGQEDAAAALSQLTGIKVRAAGELPSMTEPLEGDHPLLANLDGCLTVGPRKPLPAFEVDDRAATPLATYLGTERVAVAAKDFGRWKSVFVGCLGLSNRFIHNLARWGGAWVVAEPGDAVYASQHFLTIHALFSGHKVLRLLRPSRVIDLANRQQSWDGVAQLELDMRRGETRYFLLEPL
jgi:hypothetical protein